MTLILLVIPIIYLRIVSLAARRGSFFQGFTPFNLECSRTKLPGGVWLNHRYESLTEGQNSCESVAALYSLTSLLLKMGLKHFVNYQFNFVVAVFFPCPIFDSPAYATEGNGL